MCYKERHPLLLECFLTFPQYISIIRGTFDNIWKPLIVHIISFLPIANIKFHAKYQIVSTLSEHEMGWCVTRRDIHCCLSVSLSPFDILRMFRGASGSIYNQFMIHTVSFLPTTNVRFQAKCQISGALSALEPGWCDARRDINCYLSILYPSSDIVG